MGGTLCEVLKAVGRVGGADLAIRAQSRVVGEASCSPVQALLPPHHLNAAVVARRRAQRPVRLDRAVRSGPEVLPRRLSPSRVRRITVTRFVRLRLSHTSTRLTFDADAPFGRFFGNKSSAWTVNGRAGWLLMEIVSPLSFLYFLSTPASTSPFTFPAPSFTRVISTLSALPAARLILVAFFVVHYFNRSILSELRNPGGRSRMHLIIPFLGIVWNLANGGSNGFWIGGGGRGLDSSNFGLQDGSSSILLFIVGATMWLAGFASNVCHDNVLFRIKREKLIEAKKQKNKGKFASIDPKDRYAIPQGGLYAILSHPSYTSEWLEWIGFSLCTFALAPAAFPPSPSSTLLTKLPAILRPLEAWYVQPAPLFVIQEVAAMLPRALSGHEWYRETFGKEWEEKGARWAVLPGLL